MARRKHGVWQSAGIGGSARRKSINGVSENIMANKWRHRESGENGSVGEA